jgi:hypothetical protein
VTGCTNDEFWTNSTFSKSEYETILKKEIDGLIAKSGRLEESFFIVHGMPVWESSTWVNVDNKDMLVVPLLSSSNQSKKHIVGVVENGKISAVITDLSENRIFSLNNKILYDELSLFAPRLKNNNNEATNLLAGGGGYAQALFAAANGTATYNPNATAGTLTIKVSDAASSFFWEGHAWLEFTDNSGNSTTFSTWGNQDREYLVNYEKRNNYYADAIYSVSITYNDFQKILNYNTDPDNKNWSPTYNCAGYAAGVWKAVTGISIGEGTLTPNDIQEWIDNQ